MQFISNTRKSWRRATLLVAAVSLAIASASAQSFEHAQGGFVTWPWVWRNDSPQTPGYRVWTTEDGARIRYRDEAGTWTFQRTANADQGCLRSIAFLSDGVTGVAVGDGGQWAWTTVGNQPNAPWGVANSGGPYVNHPATGQIRPRLWHVTARGSEWWVAGEDGLLASTTNLTSPALVQAQFIGTNPVGANIQLHGVDFSADGVHGAAVGGFFTSPLSYPVGFYTADGGATWDDAVIHYLPLCGTTTIPVPTSGKFWKVSFSKQAGSKVGYACGIADSTGRAFRTDDGGRNWFEEPYECRCDSPCAASTICDLPPQVCPLPGYLITDNLTGTTMAEMYGVYTFDDGGAIAVGYAGTVVERPANSAKWFSRTDRCAFPTGPLWGVHGDGANVAWITGQSNQIRHTFDRGQSWTMDGWNVHWRLRGIETVSGGGSNPGDVVWSSGQQRRIARSTDGGVNWVEQRAYRQTGHPENGPGVSALTVHDDGDSTPSNDVGAAVGPMTSSGAWMALWTSTGGEGCGWLDAAFPVGSTPRNLNAVCTSGRTTSGATHFWSAGDGGAMLYSRDDGASWTEFVPSLTFPAPLTLGDITWTGVAFATLDDGLIVGKNGSQGFGVLISQGSTTPTATLLPTVVEPLNAVDLRGINGYAVGSLGGIYRYNRISKLFFAVTPAYTPPSPPALPLNAVQVIGAGTTHQVFVGGQDGRIIRYSGALPVDPTLWQFTPKSQTSSDFTAMSFLPTGHGYAVGVNGVAAQIGAQSTLVRYVP